MNKTLAGPYTTTINGLDEGNYVVSVTDGTPTTISQSFTILFYSVKNNNSGLFYTTIQGAINAATAGDVIESCARTYTESININKSLTLNGPNKDVPCSGSRNAEAVITGTGGNGNAAVTISADGVTLNGFTVSNPTGSFGVDQGARNNTSVKYNIITNVGDATSGSGSSFGIHYESDAAASNVSYTYNCISNIRGGQNGCPNGSNGSGVGIGFTSSTSTATLSGLTISYNTISDISACSFNGSGGKGAYGVLIGVGASASGNISGAVISNNTISNLGGRWVHAIGMEGKTPNAQVKNNDIKDLTAAASDAIGVYFEDNTGASSTVVTNNSFTGTMKYGVAVNPSATGPVVATCNWYGAADATSVTAKVAGSVTYSPWLTTGGNSASVGFVPTGTCTGAGPVHNVTKNTYYTTIQDAVSAASANDNLELLDNITEALTSAVNVKVVFDGNGKTITTSGNSYLFQFNAVGSTLKNVKIVKSDNLDQNILYVGGNNITIDGVDMTGTFNVGDGQVSRGMEVAAGVDALTVKNSSFKHLRQAAYINNVTNTVVQNSYLDNSKGWVVIASAHVTFTGNTWGSGGNANATDIAIIDDSPTIPLANVYFTCTIMKQIAANNSNPNLTNALINPASCIVTNVTKSTWFNTIQGAIDDAVTQNGDVIEAGAGTYTAPILINKQLTLKGANAGKSCGDPTRGAESIIDLGNTGFTPISLADNGGSSNVTIDGFEITGSMSNYAIYSGSTGNDNIIIRNNNIHDIGTGRGSGNIYAYAFHVGAANRSGVSITDNCITKVGNITSMQSGKGSAGIWFGQSNANGVVSNIEVKRNKISKIYSTSGAASGIDLVAAWGVGTGGLNAPVVTDNNISETQGNNGFGIQLDGKVPGTNISNNWLDNISGSSSAMGISIPASNTGAGTVVIHNNSFTNMSKAIVSLNAATTNATCNWYGAADASSVTAKVAGSVTYSPWLTSGGNSALVGFDPTGSCNGTPVVLDAITTTGETCAKNDGSITMPWTGGVANYTVSWAGTASGSTSSLTASPYTITGLAAGSYTVTVTDANGSTATSGTVTVQYTPVHNTTKGTYYTTIQGAINDANASGDVIEVCAGTYREDVVVNKEVEIYGAGATTIVQPATSNPNTGGGSLGGTNVFLVQANNVKIHDLTIDGNNPLLTSGQVFGGEDIDARCGIITNHALGVYTNLEVYKTTVKNIFLRGIYQSSGGSFNFHHNTVSNVQADPASIAMFAFGSSGVFDNNSVSDANDGIVTNWSKGTVFSNNTVTNSGSGIHTDNNAGSGGVADEIKNNIVTNSTTNGYGIMVFAPYKAVSVHDNKVNNVSVGLTLSGQQANVTPEFYNNEIDAQNKTTSTGVYVTTSLFGFGSANVSGNFHNNIITNNTSDGFYLESESNYSLTISAHNNSINNNSPYAVEESGTGTYNADMSCNWWGTANGNNILPKINGTVIYSPWLTNGTDNDLSTLGFQPVPGSCNGTPVVLGTITTTGETCAKNDGSITVSWTGGVANYTVSWVGTASGSTSGLTASPYTITGLAAGSYTVTVTDANGSTATSSTVAIQNTPVHNTTQGTYYTTIQNAINAANNGETIEVCAGTYKENVVVNKTLDIRGPNYDVNPNTQTRVPEAVITYPDGSDGGELFIVRADNVKINGFTIDGQNNVTASGSSGIMGYGDNIEITNNIVSNFNYVSVWFTSYHPDYPTPPAGTFYRNGIVIDKNHIHNSSIFSQTNGSVIGYGIYMQGAYGSVTNNVIEGTKDAIQVQPYEHPNTGNITGLVSNNDLQGYRTGIWYNAGGMGVSPVATHWEIKNNNMVGIAPPPSTTVTIWGGLRVSAYEAGTLKFNENSVLQSSANAGSYQYIYSDYGTNKNFDANCNWYGSATAGTIAARITAANAQYIPWLVNGIDNNTATGFQPVPGSCNGTPVVLGTITKADILCGQTTGSITVPWTGGVANYTVSWAGTASGSTSGLTASPYTITGLTVGTYTVTVTDANGSTATSSTVTVQYTPVHNTTQNTYYTTIQNAINAANNGETIEVCAGTYAENIVVNKEVTILGPNANVDPCSGSRAAEAIVVPATSAVGSGEIFHIKASNVTIKGFTIDGDNATLTSGVHNTTGADMDAAEGITNYEAGVNNLTVSNNIIQNLSYFGVTLFGESYSANATTGSTISNNKIQNMGTYDAGSGIALWGGGVLLYNNQYAAVTNNCMTNVRLGVQTGNFSRANPGSASYQVISGNTIQARRRGIFHNLFYSLASPYTLGNNTITALANANETLWQGVLIASMQQTASTATGNIINGTGATQATVEGINVWNDQVAPLISGGTISNVQIGINVNNFEGYNSNAANTLATIDGVTISAVSVAGVKVHDNPSNTNNATVNAEIKNSTIGGNGTGVWVLGPDATANIHDNVNTITGFAIGVDVDASAATIYRNKINANGTGVRVTNNGTLTSVKENFITNNTVDGILVTATANAANGTSAINTNDLSGNGGKSINNQSATTLANASCNWYGSLTPAVVVTKVSGSVTYSPYLTNGTDADLSTNGFQNNSCRTVLEMDPSITQVTITDLSDNLVDANQLPFNSINRVHVSIFNNDQNNPIPSGTTKIRLDLGDKMIVNPGFNLATAPLNIYFTWTQTIESGHVVIYGDQILELPADFYDDAVFETQANVVGTSVDDGTWQITNHNNNSYYLIDMDLGNNNGTATYTVLSPLTISLDSKSDVSCNGGNNGTVTVSAGGGATPYQFSIDGGNTWLPVGGTTSPYTFNGLTANTYTVKVKDNVGSITTLSPNVTIGQPTALTATISAQTNVSCHGGSTGSATVTAGGGTSPYSYSWNTSPVQTGTTATGLAAGNYTVTVTDDHGCTATESVTITEPTALTATISAQTNVSCHGGSNGSATVTAGGGTSPYTYSWNTSPVQTGATANGLAAGNYTVTVTDDHGCTATASVTISEPPVLTATITAQTNVSCHGGSNGSATVTAGGGTSPYSYSWNTSPVQTGATATGLAAGNYTVTVTDDHGCTTTASVIISEPPVLTATISAQTNVSCNGGSNGTATVTASGGTSPYTYLWSNGQTNATATGLVAGNYTVTVTDDHGCTATASVTISEPPVLTATISAQTNVSCNGGSNGTATVTAGGGTSPYTYLWSNGQTNATATGLAAGNYTVTVTDDHGCTATASVTITEPAVLSVTASGTNVTCNGNGDGTASATVSGGTQNYTYAWAASGGGTVPPLQINNPSLSGLVPGTYTVTVNDANSCGTVTASYTVTQPNVLGASVTSITHITCAGSPIGAATVTATGGTSPYSFSIDGGAYVQNGGVFTALNAGVHSVLVKDANGCTYGPVSFTINQPTNPDVSIGSQVSDNSFPVNGSENTVMYNLKELLGKAATPAVIRIFKPSGYIVSFDNTLTSISFGGPTYALDNPNWTLTTNNSGYAEYSRTGHSNQIDCNELVRIAFKLKRNTTNVSNFNFTAQFKQASGEVILTNNNNSINMTGQ